jgi:anti-sigma-K factor RskA
MSQSEIPNIDIDELLNSFIDGELDARHQIEVQRLIKHDEQIAERLRKLQECKRLVSSLPYAEAPEGTLENIKAAMEERQLPLQQRLDEREGVRHLLVRRFVAAAAMIGLVGVLAVLVYSILAPRTAVDKPFAFEQPKEPAVIVATAEKPIETGLAEMEFNGRLELKTSSPSEVTAFINRAIERNIPSDERTAAVPGELRESYALNCSRQNLRMLMADLGGIWDKFDSATLFVETDPLRPRSEASRPEEQIVIDAVAAEQVIEIVNQDDFQTRIKAAKYFAALNNITERAPGKEVLTAIEDSSPGLITIPKPVLTSSEKPVTKAAGEAQSEQKVLLTIVVTGSE